MSRLTRQQHREMRKLLLQMQAEAYRLEIKSQAAVLRAPLGQTQTAGRWLVALRNPLQLLTLAAPLLAGGRVAQLAKLLPLAITAWKLAQVLRKHFHSARPTAAGEQAQS